MSGTSRRIRHQLPRDVTLGEQFRDAQQSLDTIPSTVMRKRELLYTEPLVIGGFDRSPEAIEVIRIIDMTAQERVVNGGGTCSFVWKPNQGGAQIGSVDGLSVAANGGKKYRFTFRITFAPVGGFNG